VASDQYAMVAELYDLVYQERDDVSFYVEVARQAAGRVLELGCGTGRVLLPIAEAGMEITGVDLSAKMLGACRAKLDRLPLEVRERVHLVQADMRCFDLEGGPFSLVTIPFRAFQHLISVDDQLACLGRAFEELDDGGRLVLDLFNPSIPTLAHGPGKEHEDGPDFDLPDGRRVQQRSRVVKDDYLRQVRDVELIYDVTQPDGVKQRLLHAFPMRYLFRFEAEHLLCRAGFDVEAVYCDFAKNPYGETYPGELVLIARKDGEN
jgi:SAM-dependent methyltransferase